MAQRTKVLHITCVGGGIHTYLDLIFKYLKVENVLICPPGLVSLIKTSNKLGVPIHELEMKWKISPYHDIISIYKIVRLVRKLRPDVIHAHSSKAGVLSRLGSLFFKTPVIYSPHALAFLGAPSTKKRFFFFIERVMVFITDFVMACSESEKIRLKRSLNFGDSQIKLFNNSIEIPILKDQSFVRKRKIPTIINVGRLVKQKDPLLFVEIANELVNVHGSQIKFKMIGLGFQDELYEPIIELIKQYNLDEHIELVDWMSKENLMVELNQANLILMTSEFESFGYVVAEAACLETPAVCAMTDGLCDIVQNQKTGFLVKSRQAADFANQVLELLNNEELEMNMGIAARKFVTSRFDIKKNAPLLEDIYCSIANKN